MVSGNKRKLRPETTYVGMERYQKLEKAGENPVELGKGAYGDVYICLDRLTNTHVAMKRIKLEDTDEGMPSTALREITLLRQLNNSMRHPNIVTLLNVVSYPGRLALVFELVDTDLHKYMSRLVKPMDMEVVRSFSAQLMEGLAFCHSRGIMHRDLKPQNILINKMGQLKIADFGLARALPSIQRPLTVEVITIWYRPPEIFLGCDEYGYGVDVWSAGCVIAEMIMSRVLFRGLTEIDQIHRMFRLLGTPNPERWPSVCRLPYWRNNFPDWQPIPFRCVFPRGEELGGANLLEHVLVLDPSKRITAEAACAHRFVWEFVSAEMKSVLTEEHERLQHYQQYESRPSSRQPLVSPVAVPGRRATRAVQLGSNPGVALVTPEDEVIGLAGRSSAFEAASDGCSNSSRRLSRLRKCVVPSVTEETAATLSDDDSGEQLDQSNETSQPIATLSQSESNRNLSAMFDHVHEAQSNKEVVAIVTEPNAAEQQRPDEISAENSAQCPESSTSDSTFNTRKRTTPNVELNEAAQKRLSKTRAHRPDDSSVQHSLTASEMELVEPHESKNSKNKPSRLLLQLSGSLSGYWESKADDKDVTSVRARKSQRRTIAKK